MAVTPGLFLDTDSIKAAEITTGPVFVAPQSVPGDDTIYEPTLDAARASYHIDPDVFFTPSLGTGPVAILPAKHTDADEVLLPAMHIEPANTQLIVDTDIFHPPFIGSRRGVRSGAGVLKGSGNTVWLHGDRDKAA